MSKHATFSIVQGITRDTPDLVSFSNFDTTRHRE